MKVLFTSDWHLDAVTAGVSRFDEVAAAAKQSVRVAIEEEVDLYCFTGDLCDPDAARAPRCVAFAIEIASDLINAGIPSRWLVGNHDVIEDGSGTSVLEPLRAAAAEMMVRDTRLVRVYNRPGFDQVWDPKLKRDRTVLALPFVPRSLAYNPEDWIPDEPLQRPDLILGHLNVHGVVLASESDEYAKGRDTWLPVDLIRGRWPEAVVVNGHYHRAQTAPGNVHIPGALARLTFGEASFEPSFTVLEV